VALNGESLPENAGDGGMRSLPSLPVVGAEEGKTKAEVGMAVVVGDLCESQLHEQSLCSLVLVEGAEVGVDRPEEEVLLSPAMGLIDLRKSVYAVGGVIGVLRVSSSFFIKSAHPGRGLRAESADSSEGNVEVIGVLSCASLGLVVGDMMMSPCRR
jgi:hypothetical protein